QRRRGSRRLVRDRAGGGEHRHRPQHDDNGRRRRNAGAERNAAHAGLHRDAGLSVLGGQARRRGEKAVRRKRGNEGGGGLASTVARSARAAAQKRRRVGLWNDGIGEGYRMARARSSEVAHSYAVRLMQHLVVPTFVIDPRRRVVIWNRACERLTGVAASEVLGTSGHWRAFYEKRRYCLADLVALDRPDKVSELYQHGTPNDTGLGLSAENWCVMPKLGNHLYLAIDAGPIHDEAGNLIAVVETLRDMTDQKRAELALKTLAAKDGLTGLGNRRSFDQTLELEWSRAQRAKKPLALLFADVDHFKLFNDQHGHQ